MCFFFLSLTNKGEWFLKREGERESLTFHTKRILLYTQQGEGEGRRGRESKEVFFKLK
jgi:hypothetical protein